MNDAEQLILNVNDMSVPFASDSSSNVLGSDPDTITIVAVADGARISLTLALHILVARRTCPKAEYHVAVPESGHFDNALAEAIIRKHAKTIYSIPDPSTIIDGKLYRLENKINALKYFTNQPALLVDSDTLFLRPLPKRFLFRGTPAAVPEHGLHEYPWDRLFDLAGLNCPDFYIVLGSTEESLPWFNAGLVVVPNATKFGHIWKMMADFVVRCEWVPERWPYLDQIALPLAFAQYANDRSINYANVLPSQFNQNIFYWAGDQSIVAHGFMMHHHGRVRLITKYIPNIIAWVRDLCSEIDAVLEQLVRYDPND